jgi:hypothetical protein
MKRLITSKQISEWHPYSRGILDKIEYLCKSRSFTPREVANETSLSKHERIWTLIYVLRDWRGAESMSELMEWCFLRSEIHKSAAVSEYAADIARDTALLVRDIADNPRLSKEMDDLLSERIRLYCDRNRIAIDEERQAQLDHLVEILEK